MPSTVMRLPRLPAGVALFLLSPVLAELVSGYLAPLEFFNPLTFLITVVPYGCGALAARELVIRFRRGWPSLLLLGLAFGLLFEGLVTRVIFNPSWEGLGRMGEYTHVYGVSWTLAVGIVHFQAVMAIVCPVFIAEMLYPERRYESWIGAGTLVACGIALPAWTAVIGLFVPFIPPLPVVLTVILLVAALVALALTVPADGSSDGSWSVARPFLFAFVAGSGMTLVMVGTFVVPNFGSRPPWPALFVTLIALVAAELVTLVVLSRRGAWNDRHRLAMVAGFLAFFLVFGMMRDLDSFAGRSLVSLITAWQLVRLGRRIRACQQSDLPPPASDETLEKSRP